MIVAVVIRLILGVMLAFELKGTSLSCAAGLDNTRPSLKSPNLILKSSLATLHLRRKVLAW